MPVPPNEAEVIASLASQHGVSEDAVIVVLDALRRSGGTMAQFSHPDFGVCRNGLPA